jgi:hypothetical protein
MSLATVRPDGWPQATLVSYVNEGIILYFLISRSSPNAEIESLAPEQIVGMMPDRPDNWGPNPAG